MKIFEIGTGYTSIPAKIGAATEIVVEELTTSMQKEGEDVTILDIKDKDRASNNLPIKEVYMPHFFVSTDTSLGVLHKAKRVLYSISLTSTLKKIIKKNGGETIWLHFHNQYNLFFFLKLTPISLRSRVKIAYTVHSHAWFGEWSKIEDTIKKRYFQEVVCCQNADKVFVLNDICAKHLINHCDVSPDKVIKIINGVNVSKYNNEAVDESDRQSFIDKFNLKDKRLLFQVGSVCDRKNQLGTLKLLTSALKKDSTLVFGFAGGLIDSQYLDEIKETARFENISNQVIYLGEVSPGKELNVIYSTAIATFMNSRSEAFALVMAESLAAETPVFINSSIMNSLPFLKEKIGNGVLGIDDDFQEELNRLLTDNEYYKDLQKKGRSFIVNEYSWDKATYDYLFYFKN